MIAAPLNPFELLSRLGDVTLARPNVLVLLAVPALVLGWSIVMGRRRIVAPAMRAAALALFVLALADPQQVMRFEGVARPAVVDASASITPAMRKWSAHLLRDELKLRASDPALVFAAHSAADTVGGLESAFDAGRACDGCDPGGTNLEMALLKLASDPNAHGGPAVLVTDGWENRGDVERALGALISSQVRLDIFTPPGARDIPNVAMTGLFLPPALEKAEPFALGVTMENLNNVPVSGTIAVYRNDAPAAERKVTLKPGEQRFDFPVRTEGVGLVSYRAEFKPDDAKLDAYAEDDSLQGWVGVGARRKILILTGTGTDAK